MPRHLTKQALCLIPALGAGLFQAMLPSTAYPEGLVAQDFQRDFPKSALCQLTPPPPSLASPLTTERAKETVSSSFS